MTPVRLAWLCLILAGLALACSGSSDRRGSSGNDDAGTELTSRFLGSDSGTRTISIGQDIQFEVELQSTEGMDYTTFFFSLSGDATAATALGAGGAPAWAGVQGTVANWEWNYKAGGSNAVKMSTTGLITPAPTGATGTPVLVANGFFGETGRSGTGNANVLGTVTITADAAGDYEGGAFFIPGLDVLTGMDGDDDVTITTRSYTVVP